VQEVGLDLVQLHGDEDSTFMRKVAVPCIKVLHIVTDTSTEVVPALMASVNDFAGAGRILSLNKAQNLLIMIIMIIIIIILPTNSRHS
jgi:phosphoribosylanthranilate isomerase